MSSLYAHFPFCESRCHYCDFYSLGRDRVAPGEPLAFERALLREAELLRPASAAPLETIFLGGGTPSLTPAAAIARCLEPLTAGRLTPATEWTIEANPSSVSVENMREYRAIGINRVSMGVQSLDDELLRKLGRVHSREMALRSLEALFEAGFDNVSVDVLCGVPGQSLERLEETVRALLRFPVTHLSCYLLTLHSGHRLHAELPVDTVQLEHLLLIHELATEQGFEHYEISNFSKPGRRARHNLAYWQGASYLGLGPSAHSFDASRGVRWKNFSSLHRYAEMLNEGKLPREWEETLTDEQRELERWMLALRLEEGFPVEWLDSKRRHQEAERLQVEKLLEPHPRLPRRLRLTPRGMAVSDSIISQLA